MSALCRLVTLSLGAGVLALGTAEWVQTPHHWPWLVLEFAGGMSIGWAGMQGRSS